MTTNLLGFLPKEQERRKVICQQCEYRKVLENSTKERCGKCGCTISGRVLVGCPDYRF